MTIQCINQLMQEHKLILRAVYILKAMADSVEAGGEIDEKDVDRLLAFFRRYADDYHQGKEESILFPALRRTHDRFFSRDVHHMMEEHEQERTLTEEIEGSLRTKNSVEFVENSRRLANILATHIYKEDNILFDIANISLSPEQDAEVTSQMENFDNALRMDANDEQLRILNALEWKYLGKGVAPVALSCGALTRRR